MSKQWIVSQQATDTPDAPGTEQQAEVRRDSGSLVCVVAKHGTAAIDNQIAEQIAAVPELVKMLKSMTFIVETVAHLQGKERDLLPTTDAARALIARIGLE